MMDRFPHTRRSLAPTLKGFARDRRGNFGVMAAVTLVPVLMMVAVAADIGLFYSERTALQSAMDAASLATAQRYIANPDAKDLQDYAQAVFTANSAGVSRTTSVLSYEATNSSTQGTRELRLTACTSYDPFFLAAFAISFPGLKSTDCLSMESVATVGATTVEVAFVLDTSGSMNDSPAAGGPPKISTLKEQAKRAINAIFGASKGAGGDDPVRAAVVPFSGSVNVGPSHLNDWWMDPKGLSPIHHENLDWGKYSVAGETAKLTTGALSFWTSSANPNKYMTRQLIYKSLKAVDGSLDYRGCVESRPAPYALTDDPPTEAKPATLFVPYFAPDEADGLIGASYVNDYVTDATVGSSGASSATDRIRNVNKYFASVTKSKIDATNNDASPAFYGCNSVPLTPLTNSKSDALSAIDKLNASGSTNVPQGVEWGWKVLSKNEPFTDGRASGLENNIKAMIVMTDGENTYYNDYYRSNAAPQASLYGAYGFTGYNEPNQKVPRIFDYKPGVSTTLSNDNYTSAMNGRQAAICENAKNDGRIKLTNAKGAQLVDEKGPVTRDGILIYTIAFDIEKKFQTMVNNLLKNCSSYRLDDLRNTELPYKSKRKYFYSASNAKDLETAFNDIMASLSPLRIAR